MSIGRWTVFAIAGLLLTLSIILTLQGAEYVWATGVAMVIVMGNLLWNRRKGTTVARRGHPASEGDHQGSATRR